MQFIFLSQTLLNLDMHKKQILFKDGDKYEGDLNIDGKPHGNGTYFFKNGSKYEGAFQNNQFNGSGKLFDKQNNIVITCFFANNKAIG